MKNIIFAVAAVFALACGPEQPLPVVTVEQYVGIARTEVIQELGSASLCLDFDDDVKRIGNIGFAALPSDDGKSGQILSRCSEFSNTLFRCETDVNSEVASRLITSCRFQTFPLTSLERP